MWNRALCVDNDGVTVLSRLAEREAWLWWCGLMGVPAGPFLGAHGMSGVDRIERYAPGLDAVAETMRITDYEVCHTEGVEAAPGAELLAGLVEPWGMVTSALERLALARLRAAGVSPPKVLVSADDVQHGKPSPAGYLLAAQRLGIEPSRCTAVEDSPAGVEAARAAGMRVIGVETTVSGAELIGAHLVVPTLREAIEFWKREEAA